MNPIVSCKGEGMRGRFGMLAALAEAMLSPIAVIGSPSVTSPRRAPRRAQVAHYRRSNLNRSKRWPYAETYADARRISPFPDRPVR